LQRYEKIFEKVHKRDFLCIRAYHNQALIDEFQHRGIDVTAIYDGKAINFTFPVKYNIAENRLDAIG